VYRTSTEVQIEKVNNDISKNKEKSTEESLVEPDAVNQEGKR
jgi:hypothetical protein